MRTAIAVLMTLVLFNGGAMVSAQLPPNSSTAFRIDTDIYDDESKPPIATTKTIFTDQRYVESDESNQRVTIVDHAQSCITILDRAHERQTTISMRQLEVGLNTATSQVPAEQLRTMSSASEIPELDNQGYSIFSSEHARYRFRAIQPGSDAIAIWYSDFADWSVRVNAMYPPRKPPFLRLQLNQYLASQKQLPSEIRLGYLHPSAPKEIVARILLQESLTTKDVEFLKQVDQWRKTYREMSDTAFFDVRKNVAQNGAGAKK